MILRCTVIVHCRIRSNEEHFWRAGVSGGREIAERSGGASSEQRCCVGGLTAMTYYRKQCEVDYAYYIWRPVGERVV